MRDLRFRQIHLDFHTSEKIMGIGSEFDPDEFGDTLKAAHVNSINMFSRCHHGMIYHDTEKFPERRHPGLTCNLLPMQIEACHKRDIRCPVYITVRWDQFTANQHPEWLCQDANGNTIGTPPYEAGFYRTLCINSPFVDFLEQQTIEVCETMPMDGGWFDICFPVDCSCRHCIEGMIRDGLNPSRQEDRMKYALKVLVDFEARMYDCVHSRQPKADVFFNSGHVGPGHRARIQNYTHLELESLPSGGWGYMHFPLSQRYARQMGAATVGMTGKFQTSWGDFQSFKNVAALEFECLNMLALNAKCGVGDQLHPRGKICKETYNLIGEVYAKVEAAEPWCVNATPQVDIGLFTPEAFEVRGQSTALPGPAIGASRMLQEGGHQFNIIDGQSDLSQYKVVILPDEIPVAEDLALKLKDFITAGGAVIASHHSGLTPDDVGFGLPELGVELVGDAPFSPDFIIPDQLGSEMRDTAYVMYNKGLEVKPTASAQVLCSVLQPYFNRTWEHFCSHAHTPADKPATYPGAVQNGNCIYFMHPIFSLYNEKAAWWCKQLLLNALKRILPAPLVQIKMPSTTTTALNFQAAENRSVLHVLHYVPERRGQQFDTIEDILPIYDIATSIRVETPVKSVTLAPCGTEVEFSQVDDRVNFTIPRVDGHIMAVLQY